jgi:DnaK suppressor protein
MTINTHHFKEKLEEELSILEGELKTVGRKNPDNPKDWEPLPPQLDILQADENESSDKIEGFEENTAILKQLEIRYNDVKAALERIENGSYGKCEINGDMIEKARLEANPAARTCIEHKEKEGELR